MAIKEYAAKLIEQDATLKEIAEQKETLWVNPKFLPFEMTDAVCQLVVSDADIADAEARLERFAPFIRKCFPETECTNGIIESPLKPIPEMQKGLIEATGSPISGNLFLKMDSHLAVAGSVKARGGIYEVLYTAEQIALKEGLLKPGDSYEKFDSPEMRELLSNYSIAVGSTGNLGLSIGIMSAKLGFRVTVHMSADARQWKKDMLRSKGVTVVEYESDYSIAVAEGRRQAQSNPYCHFVDDENSKTLFLGYAVAALRLKKQLEEANIPVDDRHPLFVYLPCGVGGGPGGVSFGLKLVFGDNAHCFFAEPTHSSCMLLGMATGLNNAISVQDLQVDNLTIADGLAVGRASGFVGKVMAPFMSGCYSLEDRRMYHMLAQLADCEGIFLEPSALAGMYGPLLLAQGGGLSSYPAQAGISPEAMAHSTQLVWATGGSMVPKAEMQHYYEEGKKA